MKKINEPLKREYKKWLGVYYYYAYIYNFVCTYDVYVCEYSFESTPC